MKETSKLAEEDIRDAKLSLLDFLKFLEKTNKEESKNYFLLLKSSVQKYVRKTKTNVFPYNSHDFIDTTELSKLPWDFLTKADKFLLREQKGMGTKVNKIIDGYKTLGVEEGCNLIPSSKPEKSSIS